MNTSLNDQRHAKPTRLRRRLAGDPLPVQIHQDLEDAIIRGELEPGSRLHPENIAEQYGVSRIPVREALSSLHQAGWVEIRPRYGVYVKRRSIPEVHELFEARAGIDAHIASLASGRRTDEDIYKIQNTIEQGKSALESGELSQAVDSANAVHQLLQECARNDVLRSISMTLEKRARFYFSMIETSFVPQWLDVDREILDALVSKNSARAGGILSDHILRTGKLVAEKLAAADVE